MKDNTVYFRAMESRALFSVLKMWNDALELNLEYKLGKNAVYSGEQAKELFQKAIQEFHVEMRGLEE